MKTITQLKESAHTNRISNGGDFGEATGDIEGITIKCFASKVGVNKPGRKPYSKYSWSVNGEYVKNADIAGLIDSLVADQNGFVVAHTGS